MNPSHLHRDFLRALILFLLMPGGWSGGQAFATWSIVAVDPKTKEVGIAGASCTDYCMGIAAVAPGKGAIVAQAMSNNKARDLGLKMLKDGSSPEEIIKAISEVKFDPSRQQYGVAALGFEKASSSYTGDKCADAKGHLTGFGVAVQGNILADAKIIKAVLEAFEKASKDPKLCLADCLLIALEAGSALGGDRRCGEQTARSSFLMVAKPTDTTGHLYLSIRIPGQKPGGPNPIKLLREEYGKWNKNAKGTNHPSAEPKSVSATGPVDKDDKSGIDREGFVRQWLVLLPIRLAANESASDALNKEQIEHEAGLKPKVGDKVKVGRKELLWQKKTATTFLIDFNAILGKESDDSVAYAVSYIVAPKELSGVKMKTGSDDLCKVFLNGKEVFKYAEERGAGKDQDTTEVTLKQGINVLVAKVINVELGWGFCVRFTDRDGQPLTTLKARSRLGDHPDVPASGAEDKRLAPFDRLMTNFMEENPDVTGATLAVARDGKIVYSRGFGYADGKMAMQPNAKMRIASISKPITAVAILRLIERGKLKMDDKVFEILDLEEPKKGFDPRWRQVTIQHLLQHTGGWDREKSGCPMFRSGAICEELGIKAPAMQKDIIRHMLSNAFDFNPGERYAYSNFGYCLLGRVVEKVTGRTYDDYVRQEILLPVGARDTYLGKTLREQRLPGEVFYDVEGRKGRAILGPDLGKLVLLPYGTWCLEAMDSHGGWVSTAPDLVRFAAAFDHPDQCKLLQAKSIDTMFACPTGAAGHHKNGKEKDVFYGCGWHVRPHGQSVCDTWHDGQLAGTSTLLARHGGANLTWAVLFNGFSSRKTAPADLMDPLLHTAALAVTEWP